MIYAALVPCARLGPASELFGVAVQVIDLTRKFNCYASFSDIAKLNSWIVNEINVRLGLKVPVAGSLFPLSLLR
jgi:hypothetical protein